MKDLIKRLLEMLFILSLVYLLVGCATVHGLSRDIGDMSEWVENNTASSMQE